MADENRSAFNTRLSSHETQSVGGPGQPGETSFSRHGPVDQQGSSGAIPPSPSVDDRRRDFLCDALRQSDFLCIARGGATATTKLEGGAKSKAEPKGGVTPSGVRARGWSDVTPCSSGEERRPQKNKEVEQHPQQNR